MSLLPITPAPCERWCGSDWDSDRDIASLCCDYHHFSCWYCWSLLWSVWLPVWLILTGATGVMVATVAAMVADMVAMAVATAVTGVMVDTVVVFVVERHPDMLHVIDSLFHSLERVPIEAVMQKASNNTRNFLQTEQLRTPFFPRWSDGDTIKLHN